jgi:carboxymethylenebutenolidase
VVSPDLDAQLEAHWVQIPHPDLATLDGYIAIPPGPGPFAAVVVIQEIFGVNAHIRSVVNRLAQAGYVALAPAIFQRTAPGFEVGYSLEETVLARTHKDATTVAQLLADVQAAIAYLQSLPGVRGDRIGAMGFCFGGHVVYLAATLPDIKATASFYGGGIATMTPGGGPPTLTQTPMLQHPLYAFFGTEDPLIPLEHIDQIEAALHQSAVANHLDHRVFRYRTGHGFFCDQRGDYNAAAAAEAWLRVQELFGEQLQAG